MKKNESREEIYDGKGKDTQQAVNRQEAHYRGQEHPICKTPKRALGMTGHTEINGGQQHFSPRRHIIIWEDVKY